MKDERVDVLGCPSTLPRLTPVVRLGAYAVPATKPFEVEATCGEEDDDEDEENDDEDEEEDDDDGGIELPGAG